MMPSIGYVGTSVIRIHNSMESARTQINSVDFLEEFNNSCIDIYRKVLFSFVAAEMNRILVVEETRTRNIFYGGNQSRTIN